MIEKIKEWIKNKNREDIKNKINPIYAIKNGNLYDSDEMFNDVEELMIAVANTFHEKTAKAIFKRMDKIINSPDNLSIIDNLMTEYEELKKEFET